MEVETDTEEVIHHRKMIVELLLARCPNNDFVKDLAAQYGIDEPRFKLDDDSCILCGLCTRMCERHQDTCGNNHTGCPVFYPIAKHPYSTRSMPHRKT